MISLSDNQINQVYDLLVSRGLSFETLRDELLDHICCLIEAQMEQGAQFHSALSKAEKQFGPLGIERTQEATIYLLTLKLKRMKKTASILGIIGGVTSILGTLFKVMHWPFAGILLLAGLAITALLFIPVAMFVNMKSQNGIKDKATIVTGFTGWFILTVFALFKIMHWPGASAILMLGLGEIILLFIPLYYVRSYRKAENRWFDIGSLTVILAGIIMVLTLYSAGGPNTYYTNQTRIQEIAGMNDYQAIKKRVAQTSDALQKENPQLKNTIEQLNKSTDLVVNSFWEFRFEMLSEHYEKSSAQLDYTTSALIESGIDELDNWETLKKTSYRLYDAQISQKPPMAVDLLKQYEIVVKEMLPSTNGFNQELKDLIASFSSLPSIEKLDENNYLLHINFLNSIEKELKEFQLQLLESI